MKKVICVGLVFIALHAAAQDSTNKNTGLIYKKWKMDGHRLNDKQLKTEICKVPAAIPYYKKANTSKIIGYSFLIPAIVFAFIGSQNNRSPGNVTINNKTGFTIGALLSAGTGLFYLLRYQKNMKKAVSIHNEKIRMVY